MKIGSFQEDPEQLIAIKEQNQLSLEAIGSRSHLDGLAELAPDGIAVYPCSEDAGSPFIGANPAFCSLLGYSLEEIRALSPREIVAPEDFLVFPENVSTLTSKGSICHQKTLIAKNGGRIPVEISARLITRGEHRMVLSVVRDISLRRSMEEALRESEEGYRQLVETSPDAILVVCEGVHIYANQAAATLFVAEDGMQVVGRPLMDRIHPESQEFVRARAHQVLATGKPTPNREVKIVRFDGSVADVEAIYSAITYQGQPAIQVVLREITAQKQAEREREAKIQFLRLISLCTELRDLIHKTLLFFQKKSSCEAVGIRLKQGDDYPYFETRGCPPQFLQAENSLCIRDESGDACRDSSGNPILECMCGNVICGRFDSAKPFFTAKGSFWSNCTSDLLASTSEEDRLARTRNRCNGEGYESVALFPLRVGNRNLGLLQLNDRHKGCFNRDLIAMYELLADDLAVAILRIITEKELRLAHEKLEQRVAERTAALSGALKLLQEKEHMLLQQSRLAAMGEMINNIAHQWRQPLNALGLNIQRLSFFHECGRFNKKFLDESVAASMKLIHHMSHTIDDFRNFFKPDKERSNFRANLVLANVISLISGSFNHHQIAIEVESISDPVIYGHQNEYSQVLLNILMNARDAFKNGTDQGHRRVVIITNERDGKSLVTVRDNAGGIPAEVMARIFDPYFTTKGAGGTGIGLFMAKNIIETSMGGSLTVRNVHGGAEFIIQV